VVRYCGRARSHSGRTPPPLPRLYPQTLYGGVKTGEALGLPPCPAPKHEYGNLACTVELVSGIQAAIDHIHEFGSSHTECIVTEDAARASEFLQRVVRVPKP
jgi:hypothetical protein